MYKIPNEVIKFIEKTIEKGREKFPVGGKKFSWGKDPERYIQRWFAITITIYNNGDTSQSNSREMNWLIQTQ